MRRRKENEISEPTLIMMRDSKGRRRKIAKRPDVGQRAFGKQSTDKTEAETTQPKLTKSRRARQPRGEVAEEGEIDNGRCPRRCRY